MAFTAAVQSARPDKSAGWRLGASIVEIDGGSRDNLVRYCYVVHPCERLRKSRLESQDQTTPSLIPMSPVTAVVDVNDTNSAPAIERPAVG